MEIADKIFDSCLIVFVVSTIIIYLTDEDDLKKMSIVLQVLLAGAWCSSFFVMVGAKIAMVWLK